MGVITKKENEIIKLNRQLADESGYCITCSTSLKIDQEKRNENKNKK